MMTDGSHNSNILFQRSKTYLGAVGDSDAGKEGEESNDLGNNHVESRNCESMKKKSCVRVIFRVEVLCPIFC